MSEPQKLTLDDVRGIAELAKLDLSDEELSRYTEQISAILQYFTHLQEVDTSHIEPTASVLPLTNVMRADAPQPGLDINDVLANAPASDDNQFRVSAVLGEE